MNTPEVAFGSSTLAWLVAESTGSLPGEASSTGAC